MSARKYKSSLNVNFFNFFFLNLIITVDEVPEMGMDIYETNTLCAKFSQIFFDCI